MANKSIFRSQSGPLLPPATDRNEAGGIAYRLSDHAALAQMAATGCLNDTFYATADDQLAQVLKLASKVSTDFLARTALYCRQKGLMKDTPALLLAVLAARDAERLELVFDRVINDAKMLRNFVQIVRSGVTGRKSLGSLPKRLVLRWLEARRDEDLFRANVGQSPSLADVIKMVHPKPNTVSRDALYGYLIGKTHDASALPALVREFEAWKLQPAGPVPDVPFQMLTALPLTAEHWKDIARRASWQTTRMNLNTFARHGVFDDPLLVRLIAERLGNHTAVKRARVFPYQLLMAYTSAAATVPGAIREALQDAMEAATQNVPTVQGRVVVCPDVSGSMRSSVTGFRPGASSAVTCLHVAALMAAVLLRQNHQSLVLPFSDHVVPVQLNPRDSVMTNARKLIALPSGGTNCSAPLAALNQRKEKADLVIYVSDNESWMDTPVHGRFGGSATKTAQQWSVFKQRNPLARLVCLDIQPSTTTQAKDRADILNIGGFSDQVFEVIAAFARGELGADHWVGEINRTSL